MANRNHKTRHLVAACLNELWAIHEPKLEQMVGFLELRSSGVEIAEATIESVVKQQTEASFSRQLAAEYGHDIEADGPLIIDGIQLVELYGTLAPRMNLMMRFSGGTSTQQFATTVRKAAENEKVHTLFIEADTPGGAVSGTHEANKAVKYFQSKGKRVVVVGRNLVASAGYYIAAAADENYATPSTEIGSVGVYAILENMAEYYEAKGIKFGIFRAGELKAAGNPYEQWSEKQVASIQARIDAPYQMFVSAVAEGRSTDAKTVLETFGQGQVFLAEEAQRRGMIDGVVDSIEEVFAKLTNQKSASVAGQSPFVVAEVTMPSKVKAALVALSLIASMDASDEVAQSALNAYFRARGKDVPKSEDDIVSELMHPTSTKPAATEKPDEQPAANVQAAHEREQAEARQKAFDDAAAFRAGIERLAESGLQISDEQVEAGLKSLAKGNTSVEAEIGKIATSLPTSDKATEGERGISRVRPTGSEVDNFHSAAVDGILLKAGFDIEKPRTGAREVQRLRAVDVVRQDLALAGIQHRGLDDEAAASTWLARGGQQFFAMSGESIASPGDYPNLLSGAARRIFDDSLMLKATDYRAWTRQHPSVNDLHPHSVFAAGELGLLEDLGDDEKTPQDKISEEALAWFKADRKGKKVALTAVMVAHDQLNVFVNQLRNLRTAQDLTIQDLAVNVLVNNGTLLDGTALFHADHGNLVASGSGAAPSDAQATLMRKLMQRQKNTGDNRHFVSLRPKIVIVPVELEDAAKQTYYSISQLAEAKVAQTNATISVNRGTIDAIVTLPELEDKDSTNGTKYWYTLCDPDLLAAIKYVFQSGYEQGRTDTWYDPDTTSRYFRIETRVAVFANHYRGICRNDGQ